MRIGKQCGKKNAMKSRCTQKQNSLLISLAGTIYRLLKRNKALQCLSLPTPSLSVVDGHQNQGCPRPQTLSSSRRQPPPRPCDSPSASEHGLEEPAFPPLRRAGWSYQLHSRPPPLLVSAASGRVLGYWQGGRKGQVKMVVQLFITQTLIKW